MRIRGCAAVVAAVAVLASVAGCRTGGDGTGDRAVVAAGASAAATCAPKSAVNDDPSTGGDASDMPTAEELPDEVRCLPFVAYGSIMVQSGSTFLPHRSLMVSVVEGTLREQALALCRRLTDLGYGPGGRRGIDALSVDGDLTAGGFMSPAGAPGRVCVSVR